MIEGSVFPIWQPVGHSTHIIAKKVSEKFGMKTAHTGTLDPMAEGVIIVLLGSERLKKLEYAKWEKEYVFEIAFGLETDTYDGLGLVTNICSSVRVLTEKEISEAIRDFEGYYQQKVPLFSAIKVKGKPLHWYGREGKTEKLSIPSKDGMIFNIKLVSLHEKNIDDLIDNIVNRIQSVSGDFRQEEIIKGWKVLKGKKGASVQVAKIKVSTSSGIYIRSLSQDIANRLNRNCFVYSLTRTRNGKYTKKDSLKLENVFGRDYEKKYNFVSSTKY